MRSPEYGSRSILKPGACVTWMARSRAGHDIEECMRPEIIRTIDEIKQAIDLLRRHL
jgi:hypothetical protein